MSFLRHQEIYQVSIGSFGNDLFNERARPFDHALTHRLDESPIGYSWRVALQQSPLPLHQSAATLRQSRGELQVSVRCIVDPHLNSCLTSGVHPNPQPAGWGIRGRVDGVFVGRNEQFPTCRLGDLRESRGDSL